MPLWDMMLCVPLLCACTVSPPQARQRYMAFLGCVCVGILVPCAHTHTEQERAISVHSLAKLAVRCHDPLRMGFYELLASLHRIATASAPAQHGDTAADTPQSLQGERRCCMIEHTQPLIVCAAQAI